MAEEKLFNGAEFMPPWREVDSGTGELGKEYGPGSPQTYAKKLAEFKNWAWQNRSKESKRWDAEKLYEFMHDSEGVIRDDIAERQRDCYHYVYECGHSIRWVARKLDIKRESVRTHLKRLRVKAGI